MGTIKRKYLLKPDRSLQTTFGEEILTNENLTDEIAEKILLAHPNLSVHFLIKTDDDIIDWHIETYTSTLGDHTGDYMGSVSITNGTIQLYCDDEKITTEQLQQICDKLNSK